ESQLYCSRECRDTDHSHSITSTTAPSSPTTLAAPSSSSSASSPLLNNLPPFATTTTSTSRLLAPTSTGSTATSLPASILFSATGALDAVSPPLPPTTSTLAPHHPPMPAFDLGAPAAAWAFPGTTTTGGAPARRQRHRSASAVSSTGSASPPSSCDLAGASPVAEWYAFSAIAFSNRKPGGALGALAAPNHHAAAGFPRRSLMVDGLA
ncbi:hypothetical protein HDU96_000111, partial [Phlyctochytrium bullatum]